MGHEIEPSSGERTFHATVRLSASEPPHRYAATLHFHWDALLTYVGTYGPASDCELYHLSLIHIYPGRVEMRGDPDSHHHWRNRDGDQSNLGIPAS